MKSIVSLIKYNSSPESLKESLELCRGLDELKEDARVLIKPNLVTWFRDFRIAPFGVFTTTRLVEDLVILLKEFGCSNISIGEGSVEIEGESTMQAFKGLGYEEIKRKYGVCLIDFNKSDSTLFETENGLKLNIANEAVETDFFINFPVLKTHGQSKVSLGLKNLKGCLKQSSKKLCHHPGLHLEHCFPFIADFIKPSLTIVDGIYALEKGALHYGNAYRKEIIVASKDILAADITAAKTIGYAPDDIIHFKEYAARRGKPLIMDKYEVRGEDIDKHVKPLKWDWNWTKDNRGPGLFDKLGIQGAALPKYDDTLCSGCSPLANLVNILVLSAFKGKPLPSVEILNGKKMQARRGYDKTVLIGNCIIKANKSNPNINEAFELKGCPPSNDDVITALKEVGLDVKEEAYTDFMTKQGNKYDGKDDYSWDFYRASV